MSATQTSLHCKMVNVEFGDAVKVVRPANLFGGKIGAPCLLGHGVTLISELFSGGCSAPDDNTKRKVARIGDDVSIDSNATSCPVNNAASVVIGAGALVTHNIGNPSVYASNPTLLIPVL